MEARFGKPSLVVKVTLDKLRKIPRLQSDKPHEVWSLSDAITHAVWTFRMFGYVNDLRAEANVYLAVDKVSQGVKIKWKSHNKAINLKRPSLLEFSFWLKDQADI